MSSIADQTICPTERQWDELAVGLIRGEKALAMLNHAAACDRCAQLLRASIDIFDKTGKQSSVNIQVPPRVPWVPLAIAATLIAGICTLAVFYFRAQNDPLAQLALAYTAMRPVELRIPGAAYGPLRVDRGVGASNQPSQMLEISSRVRRELENNPRNGHWLHAKGRLALLEWRPEDALQALKSSQNAGERSPALWIDLAIADYELARKNEDSAPLQAALDELDRALQLEPDNAAALFNRALILEQLKQIQGAIADLERLLAVEPKGPWSEESARVLRRLRGPN